MKNKFLTAASLFCFVLSILAFSPKEVKALPPGAHYPKPKSCPDITKVKWVCDDGGVSCTAAPCP